MKVYELNIQTGSFMVLKPLQRLELEILILILLIYSGTTIAQIVTMNNLTMVMTVLDGEEQSTESWTFDRDRAGYAGQFIWTGIDYIGEPTPWHNQDNTPVKSSYFGIIDTAGLPKNDFYPLP